MDVRFNILFVKQANDAKRSIAYLRQNKLGRVTFLPLDQIQSNGQQNAVIKEAEKIKGFLGLGQSSYHLIKPIKF